MRSLILALATTSLMLAGTASAQTISEARMRATNMARMQAELLNGGLQKYSPANCMHQSGGGNCMISETAKGFRFRFLGGAPGWAAKRQAATLETEILVSSDGRTIRVVYNGQIRSKSKS